MKVTNVSSISDIHTRLPHLVFVLMTFPSPSSAGSLSINALHDCVYICIRQLSSFRAPTLWFIDLTVATCHIQSTFLSLCQFVQEKTDKIRKYSKSAIFVWYENGRRRLLGAQSIYTERAPLRSLMKQEIRTSVAEETAHGWSALGCHWLW